MQSPLNLFATYGFIPHGYCLSWSSGLLWLHILSDSLIVLSYYSIPVTMAYFLRQRKDFPYPWLLILFALFIVACGTTHLFSIITIWEPLYWLDGIIKAVTAIVSVSAAVLMYKVIPSALMLRSPAQLEAEIQVRIKIEEELKRYKDHLEDEVQSRTADLVLARDAAEAANRAKSVFLTSINHELRTPLNAILGFSSLMRQDTALNQAQIENLDIINRSGSHLLTLINDVLEMSKIEAGRVQLQNATFDLGALVRDVTDMMEIRARRKGLFLQLDQSSSFPRYINGDEARLRQILINLVGNAIKFTYQGGITLRMVTRESIGTHLIIEVEDTGSGISAEDQQNLFQPFVQLGKQPADNQGTGLGLAITRQFVQLMGGQIAMESTPGKGSLFRIELPLNEVSDIEMIQQQEVEIGDVVGLVPGQPNYRILIVEDQLENQVLLIRLMERIGLEVKLATNGEQGLALFQSWQPHLIWMDRRMPVMDGIEATHCIRELPGGDQVKIVAVTASAFMEEREEMLKAGMDEVVRKPYRFSEIYESLGKLLGLSYTYADVKNRPEHSQPERLNPDRLTILPTALRTELRNALETLDRERIDKVLLQVEPYDTELYKTLTNLVDNFDYPSILDVLA